MLISTHLWHCCWIKNVEMRHSHCKLLWCNAPFTEWWPVVPPGQTQASEVRYHVQFNITAWVSSLVRRNPQLWTLQNSPNLTIYLKNHVNKHFFLKLTQRWDSCSNALWQTSLYTTVPCTAEDIYDRILNTSTNLSLKSLTKHLKILAEKSVAIIIILCL